MEYKRNSTLNIVLFLGAILLFGGLTFYFNQRNAARTEPVAQSADTAEPDIFAKIGKLFTENPKYFGFFVIGVGLLILLSSVFNWDWVFKGHSYNLQKIEGIANFFGRGIARVYFGISGVVTIILGIICVVLA